MEAERKGGGGLVEQEEEGAPHWPLFFCCFCLFTVSSKSPVPEGDFERSDLPLFSGFVPTAHAVGTSGELDSRERVEL